MPDNAGRFSAQERTFMDRFAVTGDRGYSASKAGYAQPATSASKLLANTSVQAEIARIQTQRLFEEALPAAVSCLVSIVTSGQAPAGARVQAAKVILSQTLGVEGALAGKEPHEMSGEELARAIAELERVASEKAKVINPTPEVDVLA